MTNVLDEKQTLALVRFLSKKKILIVDTNTSSRIGLAKALVEMGAKMAQITLVDSFVWAEEALKTQYPEIIVADFQLNGRSGLELFELASRIDQGNTERLHVIVTKISSQAAIAQAAEGDVDVYITKPYSFEILKRAFFNAIEEKLNPNPYARTIQTGKTLLQEAKLDRAIQVFEQARTLHERPALAYYYIGQTHAINQAFERAQLSYQQGLALNHIHLKCLIGLQEALEKQGHLTDAYEITKRVISQYPVNPNRLAAAMKLAILTKNYKDVDDYYTVFLEIETRDETLIRHMCAALIIGGKYQLSQKNKALALELFKKAAITAAGRTQFLSEIITSLAHANLCDEADLFLKRFPKEEKEQADYLALDYLIISKIRPLAVQLDHGRKLIRAGHFHPMIYRLLIEATLQAGLKDTADNLTIDAQKLWSDFKVKETNESQTSQSSKTEEPILQEK